MTRSPSQQPILPELPTLAESHQEKMLKEELVLYTNLVQSYQKKLEALQTEVASLELKQKQREKEGEQIDIEIEEWIGKVDALKKLITPHVYRKLVRLN